MASTLNAALCAVAAALFWTLIGVAVGRRVLPDPMLAFPLARALGWATFNAAALPVFLLAGFTRASVGAVAITSAAVAMAVLARPGPQQPARAPRLPPFGYAGAAAMALIPAAAVTSKIGVDGVSLAVPIFDHAKIALVDAMVRLGLPPVNPFFGEVGGAAGVSYYYLWHFSAAMAALATGVSGWEADAAVTWFTAWSSLMLMMGLAVYLSRRASAAVWALTLAPVSSLRPTLEWLLGLNTVAVLLRPARGLAGWLFQSSWSPQHVQSACCAVLTMLLGAALSRRPRVAVPVTIALVAAAGFQSSLWIGGVVVPIAAAAAALVLLRDADWFTRRRFGIAAAGAALCAGALSTPLLIQQYQASLLRAVTSPVAIAPQEVLGPLFPDPIRRILDLLAFWTIFLVVQFPAVFPLGAVVLAWLARSLTAAPEGVGTVAALAALAATSLMTTWLMVSTVGDNNDLGWRAVLPCLLVLTALAAVGLADAAFGLRRAARIATAALILLGLPHTIDIARHNLSGSRSSANSAAFAQSVELWEAVRRHSEPADRIANNPLFLQKLTLWPVNLSWALLADRSSCYAGRELALAFAPLSAERREAIDAQFVRVFAGDGTADDIRDLARRYDCRVAVVTSRDGAWRRDPFTDSPFYHLVEHEDGRWRSTFCKTRDRAAPSAGLARGHQGGGHHAARRRRPTGLL